MSTNECESETKTVVISWVEECHHSQRARVPVGFDAHDCDLSNALAELDPDGFEWLERTQIEVVDAEQHDPTAQYFAPVPFAPAAAADCGEDQVADVCGVGEAVMIPGDVWRAFLSQETALDDEHPGQVSLSAVVGELLRMTAERVEMGGELR